MTTETKKPNTQKRRLKTEPKLKLELNEEQKKVIESLYNYDVVFVEGLWGSGKTFSCVAAALKSFRKKEIDKIVITRPFIPDKGLGALPGEIQTKLMFEMQPIIDNFYSLQGKELTDKMMSDGTLVFQYNGKIKGMTLSSCMFIVDEAQDCTYPQFMELLTRLGKDSKMVCTLSKEQIHSSIKTESCYYKLQKLKYSGIVGWNELKSNHRHEIINKIIDYLKEEENDTIHKN